VAKTPPPPPAHLGELGKPNIGNLDPDGRYLVDRDIAGMKMLEQGPGWGSYEKDGYQVVLGAKPSATIKSTKARSFASAALFVDGKKVLEAGHKLDQIPPKTFESLASWEVKVVVDEATQTVLGFRTGEDFPENTPSLGQPSGAQLLKAFEAHDLPGFKAALTKENANMLYMDGDSLMAKLARQTSSGDYLQAVIDAGGDAKGPGGAKALWATLDPAVVGLLLKAGLSPDAKDPEGRTRLFGATPDIMKLLLKAKADPNIQAADGTTPLFEASTPEAVQALLKAGATPNQTDGEGKTALMGADAEKTKALLAGGADPKIKDKAGKTAEDYATDPAVLALLKKPAGKPGKGSK
jgi:hypothetical protein